MKLKFSATHLVCIILIQLILIDAFLIVFFMKKVTIRPEASKDIQIAKKAEDYQARTVAADRKAEKKLSTITVQDTNQKKFSVLEDFIRRFGLDRQYSRDFRIAGRSNRLKSFIATAYDLSYESCGKYPSHPEYGITFSGKPAVKGRTIAVDPEVIPLGSKVYIEFPRNYTALNGWYVAEDTGSKIKGNIIDIYFGKSALQEARKFGRRRVSVQIIYPDGNIG
ncbi:MAG: 3D domain-containing protein [Clostridia bacterium]|nr:3D domain-containing protein [Clostridia bacterium]